MAADCAGRTSGVRLPLARVMAASAAVVLSMACLPALAQLVAQADVPAPSTFFVQGEVAQDARMAIVGATWD